MKETRANTTGLPQRAKKPVTSEYDHNRSQITDHRKKRKTPFGFCAPLKGRRRRYASHCLPAGESAGVRGVWVVCGVVCCRAGGGGGGGGTIQDRKQPVPTIEAQHGRGRGRVRQKPFLDQEPNAHALDTDLSRSPPFPLKVPNSGLFYSWLVFIPGCFAGAVVRYRGGAGGRCGGAGGRAAAGAIGHHTVTSTRRSTRSLSGQP